MAERMQTRWGKPVVVENRPGGDGLVAMAAFASANDDHVLLFSPTGSFTTHPFQHAKLPYDQDRDILPIARFSTTIVSVGATAAKFATLKDFVTRAKAEPGKLNVAIAAGITELAFDGFAHAEGLSVTKVPYRDIVQAATDVAEGRLDLMMSAYAVQRPLAETGRLKVLAVTSKQRVGLVPEIPSSPEAGFPSLHLDGLVALFGPRTLGPDTRQQIADAFLAEAKAPDIATRLGASGQVLNLGGPAELTAALKAQVEQVAAIAKATGLAPKP
jgi:tripartite-type tricarboxylate transporter receptor subunit TctC